jgi:hypothetical protein
LQAAVRRQQRKVAMASELDFEVVGQPRTESGMMIVWQVSLYRINNDPAWMTDWRDVSMVHSCILEAAHQADIGHVTLPAPEGPVAEMPEPEASGDWIVDLEEWIQVNTLTEARRRIRRTVITGPRT